MSYVVEQKVKDKIYLYKVESYWDKDKKQSRQKRTYIGPKEGSPKDEIKTIPSQLITKNFGNILLLEKIIEISGLGKILQSCFEVDYREILALAYYEIMEASPGYLFHYWLDEQNLKNVKSLHSSDLSKLHESIGKNQKEMNNFMNQWISSLAPIQGVYYDITSFSSYSTNIDFVEWGYNRDKETLPQINLGMVCSMESGLPFFYKVFPGSIVDVSTLKNLLKHLEAFHLKEITLIMDRGFFSTSNIQHIMDSPIRVTIIQPLSFSLKKAKELISLHHKSLKSNKTAFKNNEEILHHLTSPVNIGNHDFTAHIFFNEKVELEGRHRFLSSLLDIEHKHKKEKFNTKKEAQIFIDTEVPENLRVFFRWEKTLGSIIKNDAKIRGHFSKLGYFIVITNNDNLGKEEILHYYRDKDKVEKIFDAMKNEMDGERLRSHSSYSMDGRLFIKFITAIIYMQMTKIMREKKMFDKYSIAELLRELAKIKITDLNSGDPIISEVSKKQMQIFKNFDIKIP